MSSVLNGDLYQWDTGREISIASGYDWIDFSIFGVDGALRVEDPGTTVHIPNVSLTSSGKLSVYLGKLNDDGSQTVTVEHFNVIPRPKPFGYQADDDDHMNWEKVTEGVADTVTERLQEGLMDYITPQMFGAVADGKTDDAAAIQSAVNAAAASKKTSVVYMAPGTYLIKSTITVSGNVRIVGDNQISADSVYGTKVYISGTSGTPAFLIKGAEGAAIERVKVYGNTACEGIHIGADGDGNSSNNIELRNVSFSGLSAGLKVVNAWSYVIDHCRSDNCAVGFDVASGTNSTFSSCVAFNSYDCGFLVSKSNYCTYVSCGADKCKIGFKFTSACRGVTLTSCGCENTQDGGEMLEFNGSNVIATVTAFSVGKRKDSNAYDIVKAVGNCKLTLSDLSVLTTNYQPGSGGKVINIVDDSGAYPEITLINPYIGSAVTRAGDTDKCTVVGGNLSATYVEKEAGKVLSANDYSDEEKAKVAAIPTKTSQLTNDSGYLTEHQDISGKADVVHSHVVEDITDMPSIPQSADDIAYGESNVADELGSIRQDIANVLPNIERSKNLFYIHPDVIGKEYNGVTVSKDENGLYSLSGTADGSANIPLITDSITKYALPAGTYTFTVYWVKKPAFFTIKYAYGVGQRGTTILSHSSGSSEYSSATVNLERDAIVYIMINSGKNAAGKFYAQIESSSQMTEYEAPSGIADYKSRAKLTSLSSFGAYPAVLHEKAVRCNAGCFKGDVYQWIVSTNYNLHWVNIITGENGYQKYSNSGLNYDNSYHANDMCYSPVDDCFYISSMLSSGAIAKLTTGYVYDGAVYPKDGDGNVVITSGIAFNRITNEYILAGDNRYIRGENDQNHTIETSGNNWNFYVYDQNWNYLRTIVPTDTARQTKQGIETDGYYIYRIITDSDYRAYMRTYLLDGTYISETEIAELKGTELEDISYDWEHGYFVCNVNVHGEGNKTRIYNIIPDMNPKHAIGATQLMIRRMLA